MEFREIEFGSDDFQKERKLRQNVLRAPLGLTLSDEDVESEKDEQHFGLFDENGELAACVIAVIRSATEAKIRQMAVSEAHQGKGYGRQIIGDLEAHLRQRGFIHLVMHARITAVGFYEKLRYARIGPEFTEVGIPHLKMEKFLTSAT